MKILIEIYHNIMWSKYKAAVFSSLYELTNSENIKVSFIQIAETDADRTTLSAVDLSYHDYPCKLMFSGAYGAVPKFQLLRNLFVSVWNSKSELILLPGFHRPEYWAMLLAAVLKGTKRAVFCDSTIYDQRQSFAKGLLKRLFFFLCDGFFVYGKRARDYVIHYGAPRNKVFFRCQAAALPVEYSTELALHQRMTHAPCSEVPRFLYVGRLSPEKALDVLFQAFVIVHKNLPNSSLVLVGAGPQRQELEDLAKSLDIDDVVFFAGSMDADALAVEYTKASCLVLPSFSEPWGLVVNEALSWGCPVVVSHRCGCTPELVENQQTGLVFEAQNVDDLANNLIAVPARFADVEATARLSLKLISEYTPKVAAEEILAGCKKILACK